MKFSRQPDSDKAKSLQTRWSASSMMRIIFVFVSICIGHSHAQETVDSSIVDSVASDTILPAEVVPDETISTQNPTDAIVTTLDEARPEIAWDITAGKIFWAAILFISALIIIRFMTRFLEALAERWTNFRLLIKRIIPAIRIISWTAIIYLIMVEVFAPPIETLVAFTASAGIAIGFASQDILKNVFGGIMILLDRPFQVGDKIAAGGHYGEVVQIGLRTVRIVTPDDNLVSIPNGELMHESVANANAGESNCQVVAEFFLPADIDLVKIKKIAFRAAAVSRYVYLNKPIAVIVKNEVHQGRSLLKVRLKAYVLDLRHEFLFMSEMTQIVMDELKNRGMISGVEFSSHSQSIS